MDTTKAVSDTLRVLDTRTPLLQSEIDNSIDPAATAAAQATWAPIMRVADAREIAQGAVFLASDESSFAVGSCLVLDGGFTAKVADACGVNGNEASTPPKLKCHSSTLARERAVADTGALIILCPTIVRNAPVAAVVTMAPA